jgi:probable O-glycosylation ligase (exosortase A-associated)
MKHLLFMILTTACGVVGALCYDPFWGIAIYYLYAVMRPQFLWRWALDDYVPYGFGNWSWYVALATIAAAIGVKFRMVQYPRLAETDPRQPTLARPHYWWIVFGCWIGVSFLAAQDYDLALPATIEFAKIWVMVLASAFLIRRQHDLWRLLLVAAFAVCYVAYDVNFLYLQTRYISILHNGHGGLDNNGAGLMLAMAVPLCLYIWESSTRWWRWLFAAFIPVVLHAVLMTFSRGAMVALAVACPLFWLRSRQKVLLGAAYLGVALMLPLMAGKEIRERFFTLERYRDDASAQSRFQSWKAGWLIACDYPVFGIGPRNSNAVTREYGADMTGRTIHSQYIQLLADNGFLGLALYLVFLASVWLTLRRTRKLLRGRQDPEAVQALCIANSVEGGMAVFCIGAIFLSLETFELPYLLLFLGAHLDVTTNWRQLHGARAFPPLLAPPPYPNYALG